MNNILAIYNSEFENCIDLFFHNPNRGEPIKSRTVSTNYYWLIKLTWIIRDLAYKDRCVVEPSIGGFGWVATFGDGLFEGSNYEA